MILHMAESDLTKLILTLHAEVTAGFARIEEHFDKIDKKFDQIDARFDRIAIKLK